MLHSETRPKLSSLRAVAAAHGGHADAQRHDERHGDRPGRDAAGIERRGDEALRRERRQREHRQIKDDQQRLQRPAKDDAQQRQHEEQPDAHRHREDQHRIRHGRHLRGQHGQVGLGNGDQHADEEAHRHEDGQLFGFGQVRAHALAHGHHGDVRAEREQPHAQHQHRRADQEQPERAGRQRAQQQMDQHHQPRHRQHGGERFLDFFEQLSVHPSYPPFRWRCAPGGPGRGGKGRGPS